ncbi:MAG: division/cell wall cluster transcriptional repressor MraZ [Flavobacteriales bacterium]|nr:division/cell wall cluster transcriptional repressor MraZ [Flavobacteriales bacterium]
MANLIGEYECKLDAKTRFLLPVGLRKQLDPAAQERFVLNRGFEGCLVLYPMNEWEKETARMSKLNLFVTRNRKFYRQFHNGATQISLDTNGRVLIPKNLLTYADIKKELVLFAYANRIEVWAKSKYDQMMSEDLEQFADLAEEVMGELNKDDNE